MSKTIVKHVIIVQASDNIKSNILVKVIRRYLKRRNISVMVINTYHRMLHDPEISKNLKVDIVFAVGGDGTVLKAARMCAKHAIPILPVKVGHFGFINDIQADEWIDEFIAFENGSARIVEHTLLQVVVDKTKWLAVNDVAICSSVYGIIRTDVYCDDMFLTQYRCDGLIVATPTGSTAHSLSAGGPIVVPEMKAVLINPIATFALSHRCLVLPIDTNIRIEFIDAQRTNAFLIIDGRIVIGMRNKTHCVITDSGYRSKILSSGKRMYFDILRNKLNWSGTFK